MPIIRQRTAFGPGVYRGHKFTKERLMRFVEGSNKAIQAGVPIPLLERHAPINADDESTIDFAQQKGAGWVKKFELSPDGHLEWEAEVPAAVKERVDSGELKMTSPEFRDHYASEKQGVYEGPIVRHMAFTPLPGNPHQGAIETVALSELGCFQFSELDYEGPIALAEQPQPLQFTEFYKWNKAATEAGCVVVSQRLQGAKQFHEALKGNEVVGRYDFDKGHLQLAENASAKVAQPKAPKVDHPEVPDVEADESALTKETKVKKTLVPKPKQYAEDDDPEDDDDLEEEGTDDDFNWDDEVDSEGGDETYPDHEQPAPMANGQGMSIDESTLTDEDNEQGNVALEAFMAKTKPEFVQDESKWDQAKDHAFDPKQKYQNRWGVAAAAYKQLSDGEKQTPADDDSQYSEQFSEPDGQMNPTAVGSRRGLFHELVATFGGRVFGKGKAGWRRDPKNQGKFNVPAHRRQEFHAAARAAGFKLGEHYRMGTQQHSENEATQHSEGVEQFTSSRPNFYIYTDSEGKMPVLRHKPFKSKSHKHFVQYVGDKPVAVHPYPGQDKVYDHSTNEFVPVSSIKQVSQHAEEQYGEFIPHQNTRKEFVKYLQKKRPDIDIDSAKDKHYTLVKQAVLAGKTVPTHVLADYPALTNNSDTRFAEVPELDEENDNEIDNLDQAPVVDVLPPADLNPDMPPIATDRSKLQAVLAGLNQKGIVLPSDFDFMNPAALDILLGCLNSNLKAEQEAQAEQVMEANPESPPPTMAAMPYSEQFSEEELNALPPKARQALEEANKARVAAEAKAAQFAEERQQAINSAAKEGAIASIRNANLAPALKKELLSKYQSVQFSEGNDQPVYTAAEVAALVERCTPPQLKLQFEGVKQATTPKANAIMGTRNGQNVMGAPSSEQFFEAGEVPTGHMSAEAAEAIVAKSPVMKGFGNYTPLPTISQLVAAENQKHPNNVMRN